MAILAISPTRVDLAGGTLDIMPLTHILQRRKTVNFGISLHAQVELNISAQAFRLTSHDQARQIEGDFKQVTQASQIPWLEKLLAHFWHKELPALHIDIKALSPAGAGLGGSSCLGIAMASALLKAREQVGMPWEMNEQQLVQTVQDLETSLIRVPTGCQDYWGGLRGGINLISYPPGGVEVQTLREAEGQDLQNLLLLCYSGVSRASGTNNWAIFRRAFDGDQAIINSLNEIGRLAESTAEAVLAGSWVEVFRLSAEEWGLRTSLWSDIETLETKRIKAAAQQSGALFSRVCGAGGGGVMAIFAEPSQQPSVRRAVTEAGGRILDAQLSFIGTQVTGRLA
ncbi:MAG: hypothetical protein NTX25_14530 [Proteobacteria bacterium]|nr:hypothetical protein [Pseudomonadota bacterium]